MQLHKDDPTRKYHPMTQSCLALLDVKAKYQMTSIYCDLVTCVPLRGFSAMLDKLRQTAVMRKGNKCLIALFGFECAIQPQKTSRPG